MKIRILGSADMNSACFSASYLINEKVLVDIPEGTCRRLTKTGIRPESTDAVLITHMHGDHMLGLPVWALKKTKVTPPPANGSITICVPAAEKENLQAIVCGSFATSFTEEKTGRFFRWICEDSFTLGDLKVTRIPVTHGILPNCCGYLITDGTVTVGFTGDSCLCAGVKTIAALSDVVFCDCDNITGNEKHMGINDVTALTKEFPHARFIATHMKDETRAALLRETPAGITIASDGEVLEL